MSIRLKLLLSYVAMLVIPLVVTIITAVLITVVHRGDFENIQDQYANRTDLFNNEAIIRVLKEVERNARKNPSVLADKDYLKEVDAELQLNQSYLFIRKGSSLDFVSPGFEKAAFEDQLEAVAPSYQHPAIPDQLPEFDQQGHTDRETTIPVGKQLYDVYQADFLYPDHQQGTAFVLMKINPLINFARKFFPALFVALLIILVVTNTLLTYIMSRSIIRPLHKLKKAMKQIQAGDLDCRVEVSGKDEIGLLAEAFEEMRVQLKHSIAAQLQMEESRKELVSNISHDLRTPLTAIKGYVDGLGDGIADTPDKKQKYLEIISTKAEEMDRLIDELFLYSKLDLNRLPFHFEQMDMAALTADWSEELSFELAKKDVLFYSSLELPPHTVVRIDPDKIKRVFANIVSNAMKYLDKPEKKITLEAVKQQNQVMIRLADNGQGIEAHALPHIFERFYREDPSRNSHTGGSGLGLAISKQIIEGHNGLIFADSVKGEGTVITIILPLYTGERSTG